MSAPKLNEICIEINDKCTRQCLHCSTESKKLHINDYKQLDLNLLKKTIHYFVQNGGKTLEISGGEPLLHPNLFELCEYISNFNICTKLYTSGVVHDSNRKKLRAIKNEEAHFFKKNNINKIIFNLQGSNSFIHDYITNVEGSFKILHESISTAKNNELCVGTHFVPMKTNLYDIENTLNMCRNNDINELAILRFVPQGRGLTNKEYLDVSQQEFNYLIQKLKDLINTYPDFNLRTGCPLDFVSLYDDSIKTYYCKAGKCTCSISPDGNVLPCPAFKDLPEFIAGNIHSKELSDIWINKFHEFRNFHYNKIYGPCQGCKHLQKCQGRCIAQRYLKYKSIYSGPDPACPIKNSEIKTVQVDNNQMLVKA